MKAILGIGVDIVEGRWEGIKSMGKWLSDSVGSFFGGIVDGVKDLLGIKSPSTVFAGIGEKLSGRMGAMSAHMEQVAHGDYTLQMALGKDDEVGRLAPRQLEERRGCAAPAVEADANPPARFYRTAQPTTRGLMQVTRQDTPSRRAASCPICARH